LKGRFSSAGLVGALFASQLVRSLLFNVKLTDRVAIMSACATLLVVVLLAAYLPARRASAVDPARALRAE
jgi:ABC-type lipoprotein release transport system permease subunit